jgi:hypothetical protein
MARRNYVKRKYDLCHMRLQKGKKHSEDDNKKW